MIPGLEFPFFKLQAYASFHLLAFLSYKHMLVFLASFMLKALIFGQKQLELGRAMGLELLANSLKLVGHMLY